MSDLTWLGEWECKDCGFHEDDVPDFPDTPMEDKCPRCGGRHKWLGAISSAVDTSGFVRVQ